MSVTHSSPSRARADKIIAEWANRHSRTFFENLKNETRDYQTIDSLGKQIAKEYQGRYILELLQNAHDALVNAKSDDPRQISFVLITTPEPTLLVGNSGSPFLKKDFEGICQLAQSPKDPNESIGNKGLGFRSVLDISTCPEIWSTASSESAHAFAFRFHPDDFRKRMTEAAKKLEKEGLKAHSPFDPELPIIEWTQGGIEEYKKRLTQPGFSVVEEIKNLSPYQFPFPMDSAHYPKEVEELLKKGCVTVIRLPLDGGMSEAGENAMQSVKGQLEKLDARSTLFLSHLETLSIDIDGEKRTLKREVISDDEFLGCQRSRQQQLSIECSNEDPDGCSTRRFHVWTRSFGGKDHPQDEEKILDKVKDLPNRWPEVRQVTVGVAVEHTPEPEPGVFVIFLPTDEETGTGAHINAPFYGSIDRRHIEFPDKSYNELLLDFVSDLCLDVIEDLVSGEHEEWRAQAVIDILSSSAGEGRMNDLLVKQATERGYALEDQALILCCDDSWRVSNKARLLNIPDGSPISASQWRECAQFSVVSSALDGREDAVKRLIGKLNDNGSLDPTTEEWRGTIEQMAENIQSHNIEVTWNDFMKSVIAVLPYDFRQHSSGSNSGPLADMRFLPTESGRLLAADDATKLFFRPVQDDKVAELVKKPPNFLEEHIAFLHQDIQTQTQDGSQRYNTEVQQFLDRRFVRSFDRGEILRLVVNNASPKLSVSYEVSEDATRHAEILAWTLNFVGDAPSEAISKLLKDLPVACYGGWRKMSEAVFGLGWTNNGDLVWSLVDELPEDRAECLRKIALLPPDDSRWGVAKEGIKGKEDLFKTAGVFDGLRLKEAKAYEFRMNEYDYELPSSPPSGVPKEHWDDWRKIAKKEPYYTSNFKYVLSGIRLLPEIHCLSTLGQPGRKALSELVLTSIGHWPKGWEQVEIEKTSGGNYWSHGLISPLKYWLSVLPWFVDEDNGETTLAQRWLVPAHLLEKNSCPHLNPLSKELTKRLEKDPKLKDALKSLGLNVYPEEDEEKIGPELLEALANAMRDDRVQPELFAVFSEQVCHAWQHFDIEKELPKRFFVRTGEQKSRSFKVYERDGLLDVYLPDHEDRSQSLLEHNRPILEMKVTDARRVCDKLLNYTAIKRASTLEEKFVIDDTPWQGETSEIPLLNETKYKWLPVPLLAIFAHGGTNPAGAETKRWRQAADTLRAARVRECEDITVKLVDEHGKNVAKRKPEAQWLKEDKVLAVRRDTSFFYKKLAPAVQAMLDRQDLLRILQVVLQSLDGEKSPTSEQIDVAIKEVDIDTASLEDIRHRWTDDTDVLIQRVKPVLRLFGVSTDELGEIKDNQRLKEWLSDSFPQWPELFSEARQCRDDHEMGKATWRKFGDDAQLPKWNAILDKLGRDHVRNNDNGGQTEAHIEVVKPLLRGFARHVAIQAEKPDLFSKIEAISQNFQAGEDWSEQWWEVPFEAVLKALCPDYAKLPDVKRYLSAFENVRKLEELHAIFEKQGIGIETNPYDTYRRNKDRFDKMFGELCDLYETWREVNGLEAIPSGSSQDPEELDATAYLNDWQDAELFEQSFAIIKDEQFRKACAGCASPDEIREHLNLKPERVEAKRMELRQRKVQAIQEEDRKRRTYTVAGADFVVRESDYGELFKHINSLPESEAPHPDPDKFTPLEAIAGTGNGNSGGSGGGGGSYLSPPPELPELVGVVGEMWAFRYLQARFEDAVTRDAWVSKNRLKGLPLVPGEQDGTNDSFGYDFSFSHQGKRWHIEAKATKGDETQFELGTTEIEAAIRIAQSSSEQWRVLRVRRALSEEPKFDWLPNPFKEGFGKHFRRSWRGMWVSYRLKNTPSGEE